ncbi:hypothetical protein AALP_AA7G103500 [Arabis alpina]|uniref:Uncharacterized protein n=1 Tax=Arabis alpina TaxID=50452 RepID=A0A087GH59_ARAAL|nr:hypothetical protein AALP_AA7G103500 [Arabis alpina]
MYFLSFKILSRSCSNSSRATLESFFDYIYDDFRNKHLREVRQKMGPPRPDVTLAHASDHSLSAAIPIRIPLVGPTDRRSSGGSSPEIELPHHRHEVAPPQRTGPSDDHLVPDDLQEDGSSNVHPKTVRGDPMTLIGSIPIRLTHGSIRAVMAVVVLAAERGGVVNLDDFEEISSIRAIGNTGCFYISLRGGCKLVSGHSSQRMNIDMIAEQDALNSRVADLTSALVEAEEAKKKEVFRVEGEVAELKSSCKDAERSRAQTEVDRLASLASQVVGAIRRMEKASKDGVAVDAAKKEKLEAHLTGYNAEAEMIALPPLPEDSSDDEGVEPTWNLALDISSTKSSDGEAERTEVDGRMTVAGKTPALTRAEIEEVATDEDEADRLELQGGEGDGTAERAGVEEKPEIEAVDATTGEPIVPLFSQPEANPEDKESTP